MASHLSRLLPAALVALSLLSVLPLGAQSAPAQACGTQTVDDPAGDTQVPPGIPVADSAPADILQVGMSRSEATGVTMTLKLAGDPRAAGSGVLSYSIWIGFQDGGKSGGGNPPTWTFQGSTTYTTIDTMYWDHPDGYPVTWNGTTMSFTIPWKDFAAQYGKAWPLAFGSPFASTSGPAGPGLNNPSEDWATYSPDLVALQPCAAASSADAHQPGAEANPSGAAAASPSPAATPAATSSPTASGGAAQAPSATTSANAQAAAPGEHALAARAPGATTHAASAAPSVAVAGALAGLALMRRRAP